MNVVGDTHGQLHDFLKLLDLAGAPSETNWFVFNGYFVDRGAWGVELFALALAWIGPSWTEFDKLDPLPDAGATGAGTHHRATTAGRVPATVPGSRGAER